jgi:hypothetical protein
MWVMEQWNNAIEESWINGFAEFETPMVPLSRVAATCL